MANIVHVSLLLGDGSEVPYRLEVGQTFELDAGHAKRLVDLLLEKRLVGILVTDPKG